MRFVLRLVIIISVYSISQTAQAQLSITAQANAQLLAQRLVGPGVTISNVSLTGSQLATAFFKNLGGVQVAIDSGIVLTTGRTLPSGNSLGLAGPAATTASTNLGAPGDPQLGALVSPKPTRDAVVLEFDFIPAGETVAFRYVFSSDEYPTYNCSDYNDVFAFFISGPGITGVKNIALVPGTNIPVAINSINSGAPGTGISNIAVCNAMGPNSPFTQYYVNNTGNGFFTHNGHTKVLTAKSQVTPCQTYHLKIAIADVQDGIFDSGVFLEAQSLKSDPLKIADTIPLSNSKRYVVEGCKPASFEILRARKDADPMQVNLTIGGTVQNGVDVQTIPATVTIPAGDSIARVLVLPIVDNIPEGEETLEIYISRGCQLSNFYEDTIVISFRDFDTLAIKPGDTVICKNVPVQMNVAGLYTSFNWSPATGLSNGLVSNPIATPANSVTYKVSASYADCHALDSVRLRVKAIELLSSQNINCKNGTTGEIKVSGGAEWKSPASYNINSQPYGGDSSFLNLPAGIYTVRVRDASGCIDSVQVNLIQAYSDLTLSDSIVTASCTNTDGRILLTATGGKTPYTYKLDNSNYASVSSFLTIGGAHLITVKDDNNCLVTRSVSVGVDPPITFTALPSPALCSGAPSGYLYLTATGGTGQYTYSGNGSVFQQADSINVTTSLVNVTVKDNKGCSATSTFSVPVNEPVFVNAGNDTTICQGSSLTFNTTANATSFTWGGNSSSIGFDNTPNPTVFPTTATVYTVTVTKTGCTAHDTIRVDVWPAPMAYAGKDSVICYGKTISLAASGGTSYAWLPAALLSDPTSQFPIVKPTQTTRYYLRAFDSHGCPSLTYDTVLITLTPPIQAFAGNDTSIAIGQPLQLNGVDLGTSGANLFQWSPGYGLSQTNIANPIATLDREVEYTFRLNTAEGCEGSDKIRVKVYTAPEIFVPTGFTPDQDGKNDLLFAIPVGMKEFRFFRLYNRWGQLVFSTTTPLRGWDGMINGMKQQASTYIWIAEAVDFKGNVISRKGSTTLIR